MDTLLVRLKPYDRQRRHTLRRFSFGGIVFFEDRGWYRVSRALGESLRAARQLDFDEYSPPAFDVCTDKEAKAIDLREKGEKARRRQSTDALPVVLGRGEVVAAEGRGRRASSAQGDA